MKWLNETLKNILYFELCMVNFDAFHWVIPLSINHIFLKSVYAALRAEKNIDDVISPSTYLLSICDIFLETLFVDTNSRQC